MIECHEYVHLVVYCLDRGQISIASLESYTDSFSVTLLSKYLFYLVVRTKQKHGGHFNVEFVVFRVHNDGCVVKYD